MIYPVNYRMSDVQAWDVLCQLKYADEWLTLRRYSAQGYREAIEGCTWITPQYVPEGWPHSYWAYAIACDTPKRALDLASRLSDMDSERPYFAWRITYQEPAFRHLAPDGTCPVAESLQPRLLQLQTNHHKAGAERAAAILHRAIRSVS